MQPFRAPNWTDLRVGWFLSLTKTTGGSTPDDDPTGLGEVIANPGTLPATDRYWIGLRSRGITMPGEMDNRATFIGFTNRGQVSNVDRVGDSVLGSSEGGNSWRPSNSRAGWYNFLMMDASFIRAHGGGPAGELAIHFPQVPANVGGYAALLAIRLTRPEPTSRTITAWVKSDGDSANWLYSDVPTDELIRDTLEATWPASQQIGPVQMNLVPDAYYLYWPFHNSRLRFHAVAVVQAA